MKFFIFVLKEVIITISANDYKFNLNVSSILFISDYFGHSSII